jgi:hypothetical protein
MSLWDEVWRQVRAEMPQRSPRPKSWAGFFGALMVAAVIVVIWFPIRLIAEILKAIPTDRKPDHSAESQALFRDAFKRAADLPSAFTFAESVLVHTDLPTILRDAFGKALRRLYSENIMLEVPPIPGDLDGLDAIRWRDRLRREIVRMNERSLIAMRRACLSAIEAAAALLPNISGEGEITAPIASLTSPGRFVEALARPLSADLFPAFAERFEDNAAALSGGARGKTAKSQRLPEPHMFEDPTPFLAGTPFSEILATPLPIALPQSLRTSHHWIVAGTGAGKTNALQYLIAEDLQRAARGDCSIVVLDSQHQLIEKLSALKLFAPGQKLDGKLCLLDAADVDYPIAVNLFDMKLDRLSAFSNLEREKVMNSTLEMYDFIIGSLLQSEMTSRQSTLFRFVTRALFAIPDATIHTFHDILQNGATKFQSYIDALDPTTRQFFASDFNSAQFKQTKEQVIARLWAVLGNQTFLRMFSSARSKIDFFAEINTPGKVILINAEKGLLKEEGTELFGRFFLALVNQAAAQRSSLPVDRRLPCFVYVDECHNYIRNDAKIQVILAEARQQNIGVVLAHQYLAQLESPVLRALAANTSIKMAARLDSADRSAMARDMNTVPDFIRDQEVGSFACFLRGETPSAISLHFPFNALSRLEKMTASERAIVRDRNRAAYANPIDAQPKKGPETNSTAEPNTGARRNRRDADGP